MPPWNDDVL